MPLSGIGKPNLSGNLKTGFKMMTIPRAGAQKANVTGEIAGNNKLVGGGGNKPALKGIKKKKARSMY